jgi:hypothetical protein
MQCEGAAQTRRNAGQKQPSNAAEFSHCNRTHMSLPVMAHESAAASKVRLYLEASGLIDRDTFSKVFAIFYARAFLLHVINANL